MFRLTQLKHTILPQFHKCIIQDNVINKLNTSLHYQIQNRYTWNTCIPIRLFSSTSATTPVSNRNGTNKILFHRFDKEGNYVQDKISKKDLVQEAGLHARDLIVIDTGFHRRSRPAILVRDNAFVVSLSNIRAIVRHDSVYLLHPDNPGVQEFAARLSAYLKGKGSRFLTQPQSAPSVGSMRYSPPGNSTEQYALQMDDHNVEKSTSNFQVSDELDETTSMFDSGVVDDKFILAYECKVLEAILSSVCQQCDNRITLISPLVTNVLESLNTKATEPEVLHQLLPMKDMLSQFEIETSLMRNVLNELLHSDEDMLEMLLTEKQKRGIIPLEEHSQVELLLENYCSQFVGFAQEAYYLRKRVESTQSIIELKLDAYRNYMLQINVQLAIGSVALACSTVVAGFFGMNLTSGYETQPFVFYLVATGCSAGMLILFWTLNNRIKGLLPRAGNGSFDSVFNHLDEIQHILNLVRNGSKPTRISREQFQTLIRQVQGTRMSKEQVDMIYETFNIDTFEDRMSKRIKSKLKLSGSYREMIRK